MSCILDENMEEGDDDLFCPGDSSLMSDAYTVKGKNFMWQQLEALLVKRFHNSKYDY